MANWNLAAVLKPSTMAGGMGVSGQLQYVNPLTTATLSGATSGVTGQAITYIVTLNVPANQTVTITPTCPGATVFPATFTIVAGVQSGSFTVTTPADGTYSVDFTISPALTRVNRPISLATTTSQASVIRTFDLTENPMVDSGLWVQGTVFQTGVTGAAKTAVQTASGNAFGTMISPGSHFPDSCAHLANWVGNDQEVTCTIYNNGAVSGLEAEILLRADITAAHIFTYEVDCVYSGGHIVLVRWDMTSGSPDSYTVLRSGPGGEVPFNNGDQVYASIVGTLITCKYKPAGGSFSTLFTYDTAGDSVRYSTGKPGIGFWNDTGTSTNSPKLGWQDFSATSDGWLASIPTQNGQVGTAFSLDLDTLWVGPSSPTYSLASGSLPAGLSLGSTRNHVLSGTPTTQQTVTPTLRATTTVANDWASRIADLNVVWYHSFDTVNEVNQFKWSSDYNFGKNDPASQGADAALCAWVASGGADGGAFMRLTYPVGAAHGRTYWWRPFAPFTAGTTGRGVADPAANGTIALQAFNVSDGSATTYSWGATASNPGWYGSPTEQAANPTKYQGNDFYVQVRVRRADTPGAPPDNPGGGYYSITGKHVWFTCTNSSYCGQELVTNGQSVPNGDVVGTRSRHMIYNGQGFYELGQGNLPNESTTTSNWTLNWRYSGGWDTLLYHITPGTSGGTGANRTRVEVWAQHDPSLYPAESGVYTKIWDDLYTQTYDSGSNSAGAAYLPGWNALILAIYHNGSTFTTSTFNFDYDQVIFSKATIPAPP